MLGRIEERPVLAEKLLPEPHLPGLRRCGFHTQKQGQSSEQSEEASRGKHVTSGDLEDV